MNPAIAFNPAPRIERVALTQDQSCHVIDDALREPERLVEFAVAQRATFHHADDNAYPGLLLPTDGAIAAALGDFFNTHVRRLFDARRMLNMSARLALVTLPPEQLGPRQQLCHSDSVGIEPGHSIQASVLYLFRDVALGGTNFYLPNRSQSQTARIFHDAGALPRDEFARRYDMKSEYMRDSNRYFRRVASIPAKWNRLIFYDGAMLHSGDIGTPEKLDADPACGRLTLNGFFRCRRNTV